MKKIIKNYPKTEEDFGEWRDLENDFPSLAETTSHDRGITYEYIDLEDLPKELLFGVFMNYFDSKGIVINVFYDDEVNTFKYEVWNKGSYRKMKISSSILSRNEATTEAITEAFKLREAQL
jgi:hypothetical protein